MPCNQNLIVSLAALTALLAAGTAHAESRRASQSIPVATRFTPPAPAKAARQEPGRADLERGRDERNRFDNRRYKYDRDDYERGKEREGHKFEHHDRHDSPGC